MRRHLVVLAAVLLFLVGCSSDEEASERPGSPDVYEQIESTSDCDELQSQFDTAMDNVERYPAGSEKRAVPMSYAEAAEQRRQDLNC